MFSLCSNLNLVDEVLFICYTGLAVSSALVDIFVAVDMSRLLQWCGSGRYEQWQIAYSNFKRRWGGRQCISPVIIYHK